MTSSLPPYAVKINDRPPKDGPWFSYILFPLLFNAALISINSTQILLFPLSLLPPTKELHKRLLRQTKVSFAQTLFVITILFGPTSLVLTSDASIDVNALVKKDLQGNVTEVKLPERAVVIGNHQAYSDWMYIWMLSHFAHASSGIFILLKKSLKWIPIVGWGMQSFDFIFLARSWAVDQIPLSLHLKRIAQSAKESSAPIWLMIFPEGTITSDEERARSVKWSKRQNIPDTKNVLLPRSLGLFTILHHLLPTLPSLPLLDITIGYPGVPAGGYAQEYYSLFSIFHRSVPPPAIHMHLRLYQAASLPLGEGEKTLSDAGNEEDRQAFDAWLVERWREKDALLEGFCRDGRFESASGGGAGVEVPIRLAGWTEWGAAFCWGAPVATGLALWWLWSLV